MVWVGEQGNLTLIRVFPMIQMEHTDTGSIQHILTARVRLEYLRRDLAEPDKRNQRCRS